MHAGIGARAGGTRSTRPGGRPPIFCLAPAAAPSLAEAQSAFVSWAAAHAQYADDKAIDGLLRWAATAYPCPAPARAGRSR